MLRIVTNTLAFTRAREAVSKTLRRRDLSEFLTAVFAFFQAGFAPPEDDEIAEQPQDPDEY